MITVQLVSNSELDLTKHENELFFAFSKAAESKPFKRVTNHTSVTRY